MVTVECSLFTEMPAAKRKEWIRCCRCGTELMLMGELRVLVRTTPPPPEK